MVFECYAYTRSSKLCVTGDYSGTRNGAAQQSHTLLFVTDPCFTLAHEVRALPNSRRSEPTPRKYRMHRGSGLTVRTPGNQAVGLLSRKIIYHRSYCTRGRILTKGLP